MANSFLTNSFLTNNLDQVAERLWFQNPVQALSPEIIRPISFSQVPSRLEFYEEDDMLPQQTLAASGGTQDFSSSYNVSTNINSSYNFDVQQNSTSFVFNYNNTNNTTEVSYTEGDIINNAGDNITNTINATGTSGATGSVTSLSNPIWSNSAMTVTFTSVTSVFANGLITTITNNANVVITLNKLLTLSDWYESAGDFSLDQYVADVRIEGNDLIKETRDWTFDHGLLLAAPEFHADDTISPLTDCPP